MKPSVLVLCLLAAANMAKAQIGFPMIGCTLPVGVERGKTTEVKVFLHAGNTGTPGNLNGAYKVLFEGEGLSAEIVPPEKGWPAPDSKKPDELPPVREVTMRVTISSAAEPGPREFRIATRRQGGSTAGFLVVTEESDVLEKEPNNSVGEAQPISMPGAVSGRIQQGEDADHYRFKARAGQQVVFSVLCSRIEERIHDLEDRADLRLALLDASGLQLAANDDYFRADPLISYRFEKDGDYVLQVRDTRYKGSPAWAYRLSLSIGPLVTAAFPCLVRPGETVDLKLLGFNLPAPNARLHVPANLKPGEWMAQIPLAGGLSNPVKLLVSDLTQTVKVPEVTPSPLTIPGAVSSWLGDSRQMHSYKLKAKKGEAWAFEIAARRFGSDMDAEIRLKHPNGALIAANDDFGGKDSRIEWTAPEDGDYTLEVRGVDNSEGPGCFYTLSARPLKADFGLRCDLDRAAIAPANRTTWYVLLDRKFGFTGPVKVEVEGLPSGVQALPLTIPPGISVGTVFLAASPDAKIDAGSVRIYGSAELPGADGKPEAVHREAQPLGEIYVPGGGRQMSGVRSQVVAVTELNDLEVSVNTTEIKLSPGGSARVDVTLKRRPGYNKSVTLDMFIQHLGTVYANPLPPGVTVDDGASKTLLGEGETKGFVTLRAAPGAAPIQGLKVGIMANASVNFVMKTWTSSPPITLSVESPAK